MNELKIDPELESLFPPLSNEEFTQLEENILSEGCRERLIVWNGTIVDGHNRYKICQKNNLPFEIKEKEFDSKDHAVVWMIDNQKGRRNMSIPAKIEIALTRESSIRAMAKKNLALSEGRGKKGLDHGPKVEPIHTNEEIGKFAEVSGKTVSRYKAIKNSGDEETYQKVKNEEMSIRAGYDKVRPPKPREEKIENEEDKERKQIRIIKEFAAQLKKPSPVNGDGIKIQYSDPIITDLTEKIKSFINEVAEYQYISEKVCPELNSLIKSAISRLQIINSKIKEK